MLTLALALLALQDPPAPGKEHEWLKQLEGEWDVVAKFHHDANEPALEMKGVETSRLGLGGFWLLTDFKGEIFGAAFEGRGVLGWSPFKKKYVGTWIDGMLPHLAVSEGELDPAGKILRMSTEGVDFSTGKPVKERWVTEIVDVDTHTFALYRTGPDGAERKTGEMRYTRRKK